MPRRRGESKWYVVTDMVNGDYRAECYRERCAWWEDYNDRQDASTAMKRHRASHRKTNRKSTEEWND
jgi:hypothetical protein